MYKKKIEALKDAIVAGNDPYKNDDLALIQDGINGMGDYISAVINMESAIQLAQVRMEGDDFRVYVQSLDAARRHSHNGCLSSINIINRMARMYGQEEIFNIDGFDRTEIADKVIKPLVDEYFADRKK